MDLLEVPTWALHVSLKCSKGRIVIEHIFCFHVFFNYSGVFLIVQVVDSVAGSVRERPTSVWVYLFCRGEI